MASAASTAPKCASIELAPSAIVKDPVQLGAILTEFKADFAAEIAKANFSPLAVRIGWHDAGTYNAANNTGGANASIRFSEIGHAANAGILMGLDTYVQPLIEKYTAKGVSVADIFQLMGYCAVEQAGGPAMTRHFKFGRKDVTAAEAVEEGRLPDANQKHEHLHDIFYRMGFNDQEIVALSGAHTLGRAHKDRSGFDGAWTPAPLKFDNSYFVNVLKPAEGLLVLPSDACLAEYEGFKPWTEAYAKDQDLFFAHYLTAHVKLSELGAVQKDLITPVVA